MNLFRKVTSDQIIKTSDITLNLSQLIDEIDTVIVREREELTTLQTENEKALERVKKLKSIGFNNSQAVKENEELTEKINAKEAIIKTNKETIAYVDKYALMFRGYKFVPTSIFITVLKKYNIYNCESGFYIKDIPDSNIDAIILFKNNFNDLFILKDDDEVIDIDTRSNYAGGVSERRNWRWESRSAYSLSYNKAKLVDSFNIAAPLSDFNFGDSGKTRAVINQEKNSVRVENIKVDDPIVNVKVPGGYIIVTAWDKEALDPEILNANNN